MTMLAASALTEGPETGFGPDFRHVRHWLFDLDNTLYRADSGIFAQIESRMTDYVARFTGKPRDEARVLQKTLYRAHGTTLSGLMKLHGADPDEYLDYVHDIDLSALTPDPALLTALARLPGRRAIVTNGCRRHAARILQRIGAAHLFDDIWDIRTFGFVPKPDAAAYDAVVAATGLEPRMAVMFDDIPSNLTSARALGMTTVWLNTGTDFSSGAHHATEPHHETCDLPRFLSSLRI
jgi:putative hydrolase of the HAD superfamily